MKDRVIKTLMILAAVTVVFVVMARLIGKSETVADYAAANGQSLSGSDMVSPTIEVLAETSSGQKDAMVDKTKSAELTKAVEGKKQAEATKAAAEEFSQAELTKAATDRPKQSTKQNEASNPKDSFYIEEISDELKEYMRGKSYADDIDESIMNYDMLRHVVIKYNDFEGNSVDGEIVCNELIAQDLLEIFEELYYAGYQLEEVSLIDKYDADDDTSMEANNTSCFVYRVVDHTDKLSYHAYGLAIDVNPFYNPYVQFRNGADYVCPTASVPYADRTADFPYKIDENDLCYKLFKQHGFTWGGNWNSCKDYQHFEKRLR